MAKENEFYMQLINLALPPETNNHSDASERPSRGTVLPLECFFFFCVTEEYISCLSNMWLKDKE